MQSRCVKKISVIKTSNADTCSQNTGFYTLWNTQSSVSGYMSSFKIFCRCENDHNDLLLLQQNFLDKAKSLLNT
jgi:hypothetical protein